MNNIKRTRLKMATSVLIFLGAVTVYAIAKEMEGVASAGIGGILSVAMVYIGGDSYRKSDPA